MTHQYTVTGMTCVNCESKVNQLLSAVPGVIRVIPNREKNEVSISMNAHVPIALLKQALQGTKYTIEEEAQPVHEFHTDEPKAGFFATYKPIFLIFGYIILVVSFTQFNYSGFNITLWMSHFMAGFFLIFSFFKFLDLPAFANSYSNYDIIAKRWSPYGYIYPFIEFGLGILYLAPSLAIMTNSITLVIMSISSVGVIQNLMRKSPFQCACLGTVFKLPLSKVSLIEDLLMVAMSAFMLIMK